MAWGDKAAQQESPPWKAKKQASSIELHISMAAPAGEAGLPP
jgi:hypothetical protein